MFLHLSISHSVHRGEYLGRYTPRAGTPPGKYSQAGTPPGQVHPRQVHHPGRYSPTRSSACWEIRATSGRYTSYWNAFLLNVFDASFIIAEFFITLQFDYFKMSSYPLIMLLFAFLQMPVILHHWLTIHWSSTKHWVLFTIPDLPFWPVYYPHQGGISIVCLLAALPCKVLCSTAEYIISHSSCITSGILSLQSALLFY